ncbi:alanine racemase [Kribbella sp. CA-293567]|uniref:alanine racemase n=1 Tax=Kribbella sp. CA-293567 TaxID=3002436 RepID=UPI0022DD80C8|nr:alanine racemase [Kribbella sp. CA-293567]WBQ05484.1 alanine racemase [Kribbella sp. CA-293567]
MTTTPFLLLDRSRVEANIARLSTRLRALGVPLRPHLKTAKSIDVAHLLFDGGTGPVTVSTLREAEVFGAAGFTDILYAVGIAPGKLDRVRDLHDRGIRVTVLLDSVEQASAVASAGIPALLEIDCDGHRGGLLRGDPTIHRIAETLGANFAGILTHAGESYHASSPAELIAAAEHERFTAVAVAQDLRDAGLACPVVSVGATPTAHFAQDLTGVTEVRAGNFVFFDLFMAGLGVCSQDDLALSVVTTVIGHRPDRGWILTDAGWMATSRDRSTAKQSIDQCYGVVTTLDGRPLPDLLMTAASQEHGILSLRPGSSAALPNLPIGTRLRILPNHACATAAQHEGYQVGEAFWPRIHGW